MHHETVIFETRLQALRVPSPDPSPSSSSTFRSAIALSERIGEGLEKLRKTIRSNRCPIHG